MSYLTSNFSVSPEQLVVVDNAVGAIEAAIPGAFALSAEQRKSMKWMGDKSESFCRQALNIVGQNPQIVPPNIPVAQAIAKMKAIDELRPRLLRLTQLVERLADTQAALGNDILKVSFSAYRLLKMTGRTEGLESSRKDLAGIFSRSPRQQPEAPAT
jgi:hypothetical protein